jgi:hypothetical protein
MRGRVPPRFAGLSSDDKGAVPWYSAQSWDAEMAEWRNASEFYELDTGKNYRYDAENEVWCEYSNGGSGGGGGGGGMINGITGNDGTVAVSTNVVSGFADLSVSAAIAGKANKFEKSSAPGVAVDLEAVYDELTAELDGKIPRVPAAEAGVAAVFDSDGNVVPAGASASDAPVLRGEVDTTFNAASTTRLATENATAAWVNGRISDSLSTAFIREYPDVVADWYTVIEDPAGDPGSGVNPPVGLASDGDVCIAMVWDGTDKWMFTVWVRQAGAWVLDGGRPPIEAKDLHWVAVVKTEGAPSV